MWRRWVDFCETPEDPLPLRCFRVGTGLALLLTVMWMVVGGAVLPIWVDVADGGIHRLPSVGFVDLLGGASARVVWGLVVANLIAGCVLITGVGGRITALLTLQLAISLLHLNPWADAAYDTLLTNALWLCVLCPTTSKAPVGRWARLLIVFQLGLMYTSAGIQKVSVHWVPWGDLHAVYYVLQMPNFQLWDNRWLAPVSPFLQLGTLATWIWEVGGLAVVLAAFGFRRLRTVWIVTGLLMHGILLFTMELGPFAFTSLIFYVALFEGFELRSLYSRIVSRQGAPSAHASMSPSPAAASPAADARSMRAQRSR